uniref:Uncharacterized protein n=1 Tax=Timema poppense TaxID=170557 RepID=A0A7R9CRJ7_TIMPO|nr:unnamed protein product [Timema poppensis]
MGVVLSSSGLTTEDRKLGGHDVKSSGSPRSSEEMEASNVQVSYVGSSERITVAVTKGKLVSSTPPILYHSSQRSGLVNNESSRPCIYLSFSKTCHTTYLHATQHTKSKKKLPSTITPEPALREKQCLLYLAVPPSSPPQSYVRMRTSHTTSLAL